MLERKLVLVSYGPYKIWDRQLKRYKFFLEKMASHDIAPFTKGDPITLFMPAVSRGNFFAAKMVEALKQGIHIQAMPALLECWEKQNIGFLVDHVEKMVDPQSKILVVATHRDNMSLMVEYITGKKAPLNRKVPYGFLLEKEVITAQFLPI